MCEKLYGDTDTVLQYEPDTESYQGTDMCILVWD